jgi:hypothetical protein
MNYQKCPYVFLRAMSTRKLWREGSKSSIWKSLRDGLLAMAAVEGGKEQGPAPSLA